MNNFLKKIFFRSKNQNYISSKILELSKDAPVKKIFSAINNFSEISEIRYVGGCIRKIINREITDDIDLATNLKPDEVCSALKDHGIDYYESGIDHGTITALIENKKFEITSLRKDLITDGRHAKVEFSLDWKEDASRRDFTINAIYADREGNIFDPFNGKKDIEEGVVSFIGDAENRIKEDYLRILRYIRFHLNYSKKPHDLKIIKIIRRNLQGVANLSSERLLDEFKKLTNLSNFKKLFKDQDSLEIIQLIFPQFKKIKIFENPNFYIKKNFSKIDFIFIISLLVIDETDNADYFLYKFKLSKKDQKRVKFIDNFYKVKITNKFFTEKNLNKLFYFQGKQSVIDVINFYLFNSKKADKKLIKFIEIYNNKVIPTLPIGASLLISKYNLSEGKELGEKLKKIEAIWADNNFKISEKQIQNIVKN
jgi:poly(A) polymerase